MFNSIEIPDSDDDMPEPTTGMAKSITSGSETTDPSPEKQREMPDTPTSKSSEASSSNASGNLHETKAQVRHRSRKTQHTVRNASENDMQFVSMPANEVKKTDGIKTIVNNMLDSEEVQEIIQRIANERVRCNFLLATYQVRASKYSLNILLSTIFHCRYPI